ncbi:MAG TPA: ParB N-terminal domain-containing protein [Alphaproteobacteria bacterium]|nr:ParB N-terminal domain-containing protein [Alphaproteobacteria bacterium]
MFMQSVPVKLDEIYVPAKFRATLDPAKVEAIAESVITEGLKTPIQVRRDKERYVLIAGLHRLEAVRTLGETTIQAFIVAARLH